MKLTLRQPWIYSLTITVVLSVGGTAPAADSLCSALFKRLGDTPSASKPEDRFADLKAAAQNGISIVIDGKTPKNPEELKKLEEMYGAHLLFADDVPRRSPPLKVAGLVLHIGPDIERLGRAYLGDANPFLGDIAKMDTLASSKWLEYIFTHEIDPAAMAVTVSGETLAERVPRFKEKQTETMALMYSWLTRPPYDRFMTPVLEKQLLSVVESVYASTLAQFPHGAIIKNTQEYGTGDKKQLIITSKTKPQQIVDAMMERLEEVRVRINKRGKLDREHVLELLNDSSHGYARFLTAALSKPSDFIAQELLPIKKDHGGSSTEVRVDFVDGRVVEAENRYYNEYNEELLGRAMEYAQKFLSSVPLESRRLSGGMDIALLEDGSLKIIEFNFGAESGFIEGSMQTIEANEYLASLTGRSTPLLDLLESLFARSIDLPVGSNDGVSNRLTTALKEYTKEKHSIDDIALIEYGEWLRKRAIAEWKKNPTRENAERLHAKLASWFEKYYGDDADLKTLIVDDFARVTGL